MRLDPRGRRTARQRGYTLIELMSVTVLISVLAGIGIPEFEDMLNHTKVVRAIADLEAIQLEVMSFEVEHDSLPATLSDIGRGSAVDPWGRAYVYLPYDPKKVAKGQYPPGARKDKLYKPLNSTFDLYSVGRDGLTNVNLDDKKSQDDIVRGLDGIVALGSYF